MTRSDYVAACAEAGSLGWLFKKDLPKGSVLIRAIPEQRWFQIESVQTFVHRQSANQLLQDRYAWRGYHAVSLPVGLSGNHFSLCATSEGKTIGTMTVGFENPLSLNCETEFAEEVRALRATGRRLCEFTRLAVEPGSGTQAVLAALFHVAYIVAHRLRGMDSLLMEVNPRHVRYYQRMLGAHVVGGERMNAKVKAPAVLLSIDFSYVKSRIEASDLPIQGRPAERSLYSMAFARHEEEGIVARLMALQPERPSRRRAFPFRLPSWRSRGLVGS